MRILCCGSRHWRDRDAIEAVLSRHVGDGDVTVIHGGCRGADRLAGEVADALGFKVQVFEADWTRYGKSAGPVRNRRMVESGPEAAYAFTANLETSRGTADCVRRLRSAGVPVEIVGVIHATT